MFLSIDFFQLFTILKVDYKPVLFQSQESESMEPLSFFEWMAEDIDPGNDDIAEVWF